MEKVSHVPVCATAGELTDRYCGDPFPPARLSGGTGNEDDTGIKCGMDTVRGISLSRQTLAQTGYPDNRRETENGTSNPYMHPSLKKDKNLAATLHQAHLSKWEEEYLWCQLENYRIIRHMIILKIAFGIFLLSMMILIGVLFMFPAA
jgi:hypothetical protein